MPAELRIIEICRSRTCHGCGTCAGVCPTAALQMKQQPDGMWQPELASDLCTSCGLCERVCPVLSFNPEDHALEGTHNILIGSCLQCYLGHATDPLVRYRATSGGLVTALTSFALQQGLVDGVAHLHSNPTDPLMPLAHISRTIEDLQSGTGSQYLPVPINVLLHDIRTSQQRIAFVGLPCHIRGLRKAQATSRRLVDAIPLVFGLTCSHLVTHSIYDFILHKYGRSRVLLRSVSLAGNGWPGGLLFRFDGQPDLFLPRLHSLWADAFGSHLFTPHPCLHCPDLASEYADVSLADAWLPRILRTDDQGSSLVVARTSKGHTLLQQALAADLVSLHEIPIADFIRSQKAALLFKKRVATRIRSTPADLRQVLPPTVLDLPLAWFARAASALGSTHCGLACIKRSPAALLRSVRFCYKLANHLLARRLLSHD